MLDRNSDSFKLEIGQLHALWHKLGWDEAFRRVLRNAHGALDAERLLRWLEGTSVPGVDNASVTHRRLLRTMDTLVERNEAMRRALAAVLHPLGDQDLSIVFYDVTSIGVEGSSAMPGEIRQFGMSKDGGVRRQIMLGVVQTDEGLPIAHGVWEGNTAEAPALHAMVDEIPALYPVKRVGQGRGHRRDPPAGSAPERLGRQGVALSRRQRCQSGFDHQGRSAIGSIQLRHRR